ncbi:MAG: hypothetical protein WAO15_16630, partial [Mycobacterium sp.]
FMSELPRSSASSTTERCSRADVRADPRLSTHARHRQATEDCVEQRHDPSVRIRFRGGAMRADASISGKMMHGYKVGVSCDSRRWMIHVPEAGGSAMLLYRRHEP